MKVVISLPVHESPESIINQIKNIQYFVSDVLIVIHQSAFFECNDLAEYIKKFKLQNVLINPERFPTQRANGLLVDVHNSNFKLALQYSNFDYFAMHSSNDMFVKKGVENFMCNNDAGAAQWELPSIKNLVKNTPSLKNNIENSGMDKIQNPPAEKDPCLAKIINNIGISGIRGSQIEGSFYKAEIFKQIVEEVERFYSYKNPDIPVYSREEFYYPTVASKFTQNFGSVYTYFSWASPVTIEMIEAIISYNKDNQDSTIPDLTNIFNVKRISRNINDPIRKYITNYSLD